MPLYPYSCTKCGYHFEKIQSFSAEPLEKCPKCKGALIRELSAPALQFKGSGFYVNDYSGKSSAPAKSDAPACAGSSPACASCPAAAAAD